MIPRAPIETIRDKDKLREIVKKQTEEFLKNGGTITKVADGASAYDANPKWDVNSVQGRFERKT